MLVRFSYATFWQYADSGPNPGDQDEFNGSADGLKRYVPRPIRHMTLISALTRSLVLKDRAGLNMTLDYACVNDRRRINLARKSCYSIWQLGLYDDRAWMLLFREMREPSAHTCAPS